MNYVIFNFKKPLIWICLCMCVCTCGGAKQVAPNKQVIEKVQERAINMISGLKGETYEEKLNWASKHLKIGKL